MGEHQILAWLEENCASLALDSEDRAYLAEMLADYIEGLMESDVYDEYESRGLSRSDF